MTTHQRHFLFWLAAVLAFAALGVPVAQAGPDDRALVRSTSAVGEQPRVSPDDRPLARSSAALESQISPDDRAGYRGTSVDQSAPAINVSSTSPDDRSLPRSAGITATAVPVSAVVKASDGFDWQEAALGAGLGMLVAGLGLGALLVRQGRRGALKPA